MAANARLTRYRCARTVEAQQEWRELECLRIVMMQVNELVD